MRYLLSFVLLFFVANSFAQKKYSEKELAAMKQQLMTAVASHAKDVQVMVDQIFSYSELGFQEKETFTYLTNTLSKN